MYPSSSNLFLGWNCNHDEQKEGKEEMGAVYKKTYTKPLPPDVEIIERRDGRIARWKDSNGKTKTAGCGL